MNEGRAPRDNQKGQGSLLGARPALWGHSGDQEGALTGRCLGLHHQWLMPQGRLLSDTSVPGESLESAAVEPGDPPAMVLQPALSAMCWGPAVGRALGTEAVGPPHSPRAPKPLHLLLQRLILPLQPV